MGIIRWLLRNFDYITSENVYLLQKKAVCNVKDQRNGSPVSWGCRIHQMHHCRGVRPPALPMSVLGMTKQSDGEVPVLELWEVPLHFNCSQIRVVAPDRVLSMVQIELFDI